MKKIYKLAKWHGKKKNKFFTVSSSSRTVSNPMKVADSRFEMNIIVYTAHHTLRQFLSQHVDFTNIYELRNGQNGSQKRSPSKPLHTKTLPLPQGAHKTGRMKKGSRGQSHSAHLQDKKVRSSKEQGVIYSSCIESQNGLG